jgi:kinesin family protein 3/17
VTQANESTGEIVVQDPAELLPGSTGNMPKSFSFDAVFGETSTQRQVYDTCAAPVVESVLNGFNGTIFAYGQTGYVGE